MEHSNITPHESGLAGETLFSAQDLRKAMMKHQMTEFAKEEAREREMAQARAERVKQFRNPIEITEETLANFMRRVQQAADHGDRQTLILRFPSDLCTDSGRAINNALESWEKTLVGSPKQIYDVWAENNRAEGAGGHQWCVHLRGGRRHIGRQRQHRGNDEPEWRGASHGFDQRGVELKLAAEGVKVALTQ